MYRYFPVLLDLKGVACLVVGGGKVAARKVESLVECGAVVRVISPELCPELGSQVGPSVEWTARAFADGDTEGFWLVVVATDDAQVNRTASAEARGRGCLVNVVDCAPESNFIVPSILRRGDLTVAVSTAGASPAWAKQIRAELEKRFGWEISPFLELMAALRPLVVEAFPPGAPRETAFHRLAASRIVEELREENPKGMTVEIANVFGNSFAAYAERIQTLVAAAVGAAAEASLREAKDADRQG